MTVTLRPLTAENWEESIDLQVSDEQKEYVAPNLYSIAESRFEPTFVILAIYADEQMVGFAMYDTVDYCIVRFMIDKRFQGKGYGRAAMLLLIDQFEGEFAHPSACLSFVPGNIAAERLYESVGFYRTGEMDEDELVMKRALVARHSPNTKDDGVSW
jgi:diamine N-acetyltransferase